jgi:hypothetical protein
LPIRQADIAISILDSNGATLKYVLLQPEMISSFRSIFDRGLNEQPELRPSARELADAFTAIGHSFHVENRKSQAWNRVLQLCVILAF